MTALPRRREEWDMARSRDDFFRWPSEMWEEHLASQLRRVASNVYETDEEVVVEMAVPGVSPENISINVTGESLTVSGESKAEEEGTKRNYYQRQLRYGSFVQSISLPTAVNPDKAEANFENGVLKVTLPKAEGAKSKRIQIKTR